MSDRLRPLWRFNDLDASEERFRAQLEAETSAAGRAEVLTQLARVEGLRGAFDEGEELLREAESLAGPSPVARARVDLERGRLLRSGGEPERALPLFEAAFRTALDAGELFIAVDAAHMAALAAPDDEQFIAWTERGIVLAEAAGPSVRYWLGSLLNNLGWRYYEAGDHTQALAAFTRALEEREGDAGDAEPIALARYAVAKTLRALGRAEEARPFAEQAVAWAEAEGRPGAWYHEELAETYAALGRAGDARTHAERALALLAEADPELEPEGARAERLRALARAS